MFETSTALPVVAVEPPNPVFEPVMVTVSTKGSSIGSAGLKDPFGYGEPGSPVPDGYNES